MSLSVSYYLADIYELDLFRLINQYVIQSVKQYTNQYNVKFKMLYLINGNACVFRHFFDRTVVSISCFLISDRSLHSRKNSDLLWSLLSSKNLTVPDHDRFLHIAVKFQERWNFFNVIGCRDGKQIRIKCLTKAGSLFYNYKHFFIVLQVVADSESRFVFIDIGANGKQSDGGVFFGSTLYHFLEDSESI